MLNKQDVRYLLIDETWPEDYSDPDLHVKADEILREIEKLRHNTMYEDWIVKQGREIDKTNRILFLAGVLHLFALNPTLALSVLDETKSKYKTKEDVEKALNNRIFDKKVEAEKAKGKKEDKKELTFEELCVPIEQYFKMQLDYNITTSKFIAWENRLKESISKQSA